MRIFAIMFALLLALISMGVTTKDQQAHNFSLDFSLALLDARTSTLLIEQKTIADEEGYLLRIASSSSSSLDLKSNRFVYLNLEKKTRDTNHQDWKPLGQIVVQIEPETKDDDAEVVAVSYKSMND